MVDFVKIFTSLLLFSYLSSAKEQNIKFGNLSMAHGLAASRVFDLIEDRLGFMWFATEAGLHKYDGYKFTIYQYDHNDPNSISDNFITWLCEDVNGHLWVGTYSGGLNQFDPVTGKFSRYLYDPDNPRSLSNDNIMSISACPQDSGQFIWIGTNWGLNKFNLNTGTFKRYFQFKRYTYTNNSIGALLCDKTGILWIGTSHGLYHYKAEIDSFLCFIEKIAVKCIYEDRYGYLWVGTARDGGLYKIDREKGYNQHYKHDEDNPFSLSNGNVRAIGEDLQGNLWVGSYNGLNLYSKEKDNFQRIYHIPNDPHSLNDNQITKIFQGRFEPLWIATCRGINKIINRRNKFTGFRIEPELENKPGYHSVRAIHKDIGNYQNYLWVSGWGGGLFRFNMTAQSLRQIYNRSHIGGNYIKAIYQDPFRSNLLWLGTWGSGLWLFDKDNLQFSKQLSKGWEPYFIYTIVQSQGEGLFIGSATGLYIFNPEDHTYEAIDDSAVQKQNDYITAIYEKEPGHLWLGTYYSGLKQLTYSRDFDGRIRTTYHYYKHQPDRLHSLSCNAITCIYEDFNGNLWIGTRGGGINKYIKVDDNFFCYDKNHGLPSNIIHAILEDNQEHLWISTQNGLSRFNPETEIFDNFDINDGLPCNEFNPRAAEKSGDGIMYFGGSNGFNFFHPDSILFNQFIPPIVITDFQIFNKSVDPGPDSPIKTQVSMINEITLTHDQNVFSFEFAALDYSSPLKNRYTYKMEGVDPEWVGTDASRRFATYTNLNPGEYTFRVKGSNNDGIWNETGASVKVIIRPPWWRTYWAYISYMIFFIHLLYSLRRYDLKRQQLKHELELEHVHAEKLQELDRLKSRFFTNISHEFRTPLTLLLAPIETMLGRIRDRKSLDELSRMKRNAKRLHRLINQLLDLSRLETGAMKLHVTEENIVRLIKNLIQSFESLAMQRGIDLKFRSENDEIIAFVDKNKIEDILINVLSNAFKFTAPGGRVEVTVDTGIKEPPPQFPNARRKAVYSPLNKGDKGSQKDCLILKITDTGIGIPPELVDKIFDRFYQTLDAELRPHEGSGIGLALTKELVGLHHGDIEVGSKPNKGTTFTIYLPLGCQHFNAEDFGAESRQAEEPVQTGIIDELEIICADTETKPAITFPFHKRPVVLIVEDNADMRSYLHELLETQYDIIEAQDGLTGLEAATKTIPDLILSDVRMPGMDGFELCQKVKTDERISHIPIILLTFRATVQDKVDGLETGADDYITKPFEAIELKVRIKNLLIQRTKLKERFSHEAIFPIKEMAPTSTDEKFLTRAMTIIEKEISNPAFDVANFAQAMAISRAHLYTKLHALTDQSVKQFIRTIRLKYAAQLLQKHTGNISEIAYQVGFGNPAYFSECFRKQFGQPPSKFALKN